MTMVANVRIVDVVAAVTNDGVEHLRPIRYGPALRVRRRDVDGSKTIRREEYCLRRHKALLRPSRALSEAPVGSPAVFRPSTWNSDAAWRLRN